MVADICTICWVPINFLKTHFLLSLGSIRFYNLNSVENFWLQEHKHNMANQVYSHTDTDYNALSLIKNSPHTFGGFCMRRQDAYQNTMQWFPQTQLLNLYDVFFFF